MTAKTDSQERRNGAHRFNQASKIMMWSVGIYIAIVSGVQGWTLTEIVTHEVRLAKIEANRWTSADAAQQNLDLMQVLTGIQQEFAAVVARLPKTFPPEETRQTLREIEKRLDELEREMIRERSHRHGE